MIRKAVIVALTLGAVTSVALAVASYRIGAFLATRPTRHLYFDVELCRSWLCVEVLTSSDATVLDNWRSGSGFWALEALRGYTFRWYGDPIWHNGKPVPGTSQSRQCLSLHLGSMLFATYPTIAFIRGPLRRWRRRRRGECLTCGYNLTGNVSGVCPECGTQT